MLVSPGLAPCDGLPVSAQRGLAFVGIALSMIRTPSRWSTSC